MRVIFRSEQKSKTRKRKKFKRVQSSEFEKRVETYGNTYFVDLSWSITHTHTRGGVGRSREEGVILWTVRRVDDARVKVGGQHFFLVFWIFREEKKK